MLLNAHYCFLNAIYSPFSKMDVLQMHRCVPQTNGASPAFRPENFLVTVVTPGWHRVVSGTSNTLLQFLHSNLPLFVAIISCSVLVISILLQLFLHSIYGSFQASFNFSFCVFGSYVGIQGQ